jgi:hypothetical protein
LGSLWLRAAVGTTFVGFIPIMRANGTGSVYPAIYEVWKARSLER